MLQNPSSCLEERVWRRSARPTVPVSLTASLVIGNLWIVGNVLIGQTAGEATLFIMVGDAPAPSTRLHYESAMVALVGLATSPLSCRSGIPLVLGHCCFF